jgi:hypothetical protein
MEDELWVACIKLSRWTLLLRNMMTQMHIIYVDRWNTPKNWTELATLLQFSPCEQFISNQNLSKWLLRMKSPNSLSVTMFYGEVQFPYTSRALSNCSMSLARSHEGEWESGC